MGFRDAVKQKAEEKANSFGPVRIYGGKVFNDKTGEGGGINDAHATVETSGEIEKRITATRILATGVFALALRKKKDNRELFLTVEGEGFAFVVEVDPKKQAEARQFAAKINTAARST
jgi:predicted  nucleic acid-binding Zn-ribbon protein